MGVDGMIRIFVFFSLEGIKPPFFVETWFLLDDDLN